MKKALVTRYLELCVLIDEKNPTTLVNKDLFEPALQMLLRMSKNYLDISDETLDALDYY
ncbi:hypothetical protein PCCS19_33070 [Paenibacillus sp. CCS19]|nr:hypothetical protein PCCS19_33070 [Paenibacillus cellulosilyticus]